LYVNNDDALMDDDNMILIHVTGEVADTL